MYSWAGEQTTLHLSKSSCPGYTARYVAFLLVCIRSYKEEQLGVNLQIRGSPEIQTQPPAAHKFPAHLVLEPDRLDRIWYSLGEGTLRYAVL